MRELDTDKFIRALRQSCKDSKLKLEIENKKGSHKGLVIQDPETNQSVTLVIAGHGKVSPGVQREIIRFLASKAARVALAEVIREIVQRLVG
jgi:hypothetical protein